MMKDDNREYKLEVLFPDFAADFDRQVKKAKSSGAILEGEYTDIEIGRYVLSIIGRGYFDDFSNTSIWTKWKRLRRALRPFIG